MEIKLNNTAKVALIDGEDYHLVRNLNWYCVERRTKGHVNFYAVAEFESNKQRDHIYLHRLVLGLRKNDGLQVDHENHNGLDDRKQNLRIATQVQNNANQRKRTNRKFKGVSKFRNSFRAQISLNNKTHHIGCFSTEELAAKAYDKKAKEVWSNFACLNFPEAS